MEKKIKKNCSNCGKIGHFYKNCEDPVMSYGIILIKMIEPINLNITENDEHINLNYKNNFKKSNIKSETSPDVYKNSSDGMMGNSIKFLMIMRKHTLGYIEFIRGKYNSDDFSKIIFMFRQMTFQEIDKIKIMSFDELWSDFWGPYDKKTSNQNEYNKSKNKFYRMKNFTDLRLSFYVNNVASNGKNAEWGFPKGRRNKNENDLICAMREFEEETGMKSDDYKICENFSPLIEEFVGTNNIKYKHIYYLAIATNEIIPSIEKNNINQYYEIGDIKYLENEKAINCIRPYHIQRKNIINNIYNYINSL
jgi:hypothetical protein